MLSDKRQPLPVALFPRLPRLALLVREELPVEQEEAAEEVALRPHLQETSTALTAEREETPVHLALPAGQQEPFLLRPQGRAEAEEAAEEQAACSRRQVRLAEPELAEQQASMAKLLLSGSSNGQTDSSDLYR